jgi:hypothetical protein
VTQNCWPEGEACPSRSVRPAVRPAVKGMFYRWETSLSVSSEGRTERVDGELVSGTYFPVLGVGAALGRVFYA